MYKFNAIYLFQSPFYCRDNFRASGVIARFQLLLLYVTKISGALIPVVYVLFLYAVKYLPKKISEPPKRLCSSFRYYDGWGLSQAVQQFRDKKQSELCRLQIISCLFIKFKVPSIKRVRVKRLVTCKNTTKAAEVKYSKHLLMSKRSKADSEFN